MVERQEIDALKKQVAAYRLLAVNEGWNWRMVDVYGHAEYAAQRVLEIDRRAIQTIASGYDADGYLRGILAATPSSDHTEDKE